MLAVYKKDVCTKNKKRKKWAGGRARTKDGKAYATKAVGIAVVGDDGTKERRHVVWRITKGATPKGAQHDGIVAVGQCNVEDDSHLLHHEIGIAAVDAQRTV